MEPRAAATIPAVGCWVCGGEESVPAPGLAPLAMRECPSCGFAFQPDWEHDLDGLYDNEYFATYDRGRDYAASRTRRLEAAVRLTLVRRFVQDGRLLELGSAAGHFLSQAQGAGFAVLGVEPNEDMARTAETLWSVDVVAGRVEDVELGTEQFAAVCGWHVLEHIPEPLPVIARLRTTLMTGGYAFFEVPNYASVRARRDLADWCYLDPLHHVAQYTPAAARTLMERGGLTPIEVETVPWAVYKHHPRKLLSYAKQGLILGRSTFGPDPWKHELLRVVARRSD